MWRSQFNKSQNEHEVCTLNSNLGQINSNFSPDFTYWGYLKMSLRGSRSAFVTRQEMYKTVPKGKQFYILLYIKRCGVGVTL